MAISTRDILNEGEKQWKKNINVSNNDECNRNWLKKKRVIHGIGNNCFKKFTKYTEIIFNDCEYEQPAIIRAISKNQIDSRIMISRKMEGKRI